LIQFVLTRVFFAFMLRYKAKLQEMALAVYGELVAAGTETV